MRHVGTDDVVGHRRSGAEERSVCFDAVSARRRAVVEHCAGETRPAFYRGRGGGGHGGEGGGGRGEVDLILFRCKSKMRANTQTD